MRRPDWPETLSQVIEQARQRPFRWGEHDCVSFAADCVQALTGRDPLGSLRGAYSGARGAQRLLAAEHGDLDHALCRRFGDSITATLAHRGDLVLWHQPVVGQTLGVCLGALFAVPGERGLRYLQLAAATLAWRID
jgi:hypothetical protein